MAVGDNGFDRRHSQNAKHQGSDMKLFRLFQFWQSNTNSHNNGQTTSISSSLDQNLQSQSNRHLMETSKTKPKTASFVARSLLPLRRRLSLDPANRLYFPYEPGKQVKSAIKLKNTSRSHVAFKFQTTAPKSCYMRPPGGILAPGEAIIATVFRFVEQPECNAKHPDQKDKVKFKIMSLKVTEDIDYLPELFEEQRDEVVVERILRVVFLDAERPCAALEKLKCQLAEAEAAIVVRKKPAVAVGPCLIGEGLVIDEWKERREKYLAKQQQIEAVELL